MSRSVEPQSDQELLVEVEAQASSRRRFPAWLEARFEADTGARYGLLFSADLTRTALYYNLMWVGDFLLAPDTVRLAGALHFLVVTPAILGVAWICRRRPAPLARDVMAALLPFLITCQILTVFTLSASPAISQYLFFVTLNVATVNSAMRLRARAARWSTYATLAALAATLAFTNKVPIETAVMQYFSLGVCGLVTLRGMADREREFRRAYLYALRDRLRIAATDAEANRDALTGAANRRGLEIAARAAWSGKDGPAAVILFDVDNFKIYNDLYGHPAGDVCLRKIASAALGVLGRRGALLARYGGEEFLALLKGPAAEEAEAIAEELRRAVLALGLVHAGGADRRVVSASFGVAHGRTGETGFETLTASADAALYAAKTAGRNRVNCALAA